MYKVMGTDGRPYGPASIEVIRQWITEGRINAQTLIQIEGAMKWIPLASIPELAATLATQPPPPPVPRHVSDRASTKIAAGVCGIILGSLGIHKFILGYTGPGLILLLVTLLTCGIAYPVTWVIGLIEGIIYLTKSDEEFVRTYMDGRKEWF